MGKSSRLVLLLIMMSLGALVLAGCSIELGGYTVTIGEPDSPEDDDTSSVKNDKTKPDKEDSDIPPKGTGYWKRSGEPEIEAKTVKSPGFTWTHDGIYSTSCQGVYDGKDADGKKIHMERSFSWTEPPAIIVPPVAPYFELRSPEGYKANDSFGVTCYFADATVDELSLNIATYSGPRTSPNPIIAKSTDAEFVNREKAIVNGLVGADGKPMVKNLTVGIYWAPHGADSMKWIYHYEWVPNK